MSVFIYFKQRCHYCNVKPYLWYHGSLAWWKNDFFFQRRKIFLPCACAAWLGKGEGMKLKMFGKYHLGTNQRILVKYFPDDFTFHICLTMWKNWFGDNFPCEHPQLSSSALLVTTKTFCIYFQNELLLLLCTWISTVLLSLLTPNFPSRVSSEVSPAHEPLSSRWALWCSVRAPERCGRSIPWH